MEDSQKKNWLITKVFLADYFRVTRATLDAWLKQYEEKAGKPLDLKNGRAVIDWIIDVKCQQEE
jgi:hypothetical protein